jgi:pyruvate/2-oxoglutarate dehydrogenase complex dihydrolipoamide dehydrogenase (E3) component
MKAIVDADSGQILGGAVLGSEGGEITTMIQIAMLGKLTYTAMADAIFTHPLLAEGLNDLFAMFDTQSAVTDKESKSSGAQALQMT